MKNKFRILYQLLGLLLLFSACSPNQYEMGALASKDALKFSVTPNATDPNMIVLKSLTPNATPLWVTPLGRSIRMQDTVRIPFPGTYKFVYGVQSAGGFVQADTLTLNITTTNTSYVNDPLWTLICGGVGNEKTWLLDLNADGVSKYFTGPMFFYGTQDSWTTIEMLAAGKSYDQIKAETGLTDVWNWSPDYPGNSWLMSKGDYGTMTFGLKGSPSIKVNHKMISSLGSQNGTYFLDADKKTLSMTNAGILHDAGRNGVVINWGSARIFSLTENTMQLAILRDAALSGEGACLLVYNFISKSYSDNWKPAEVFYEEPIKTSFTQSDLVGTWKYNLIGQNWIGWQVKGSGSGGSQLNNWFTREDMITTLTGWGGSASTFTNADANTYIFKADGTCMLNGIANTYSVTKGAITFGKALDGTEWSLVYIALTGTTVNVLNVTSIGTTPYTSSGIWLGIRNGTKNEDQAIQLVKQY